MATEDEQGMTNDSALITKEIRMTRINYFRPLAKCIRGDEEGVHTPAFICAIFVPSHFEVVCSCAL